MFHEQIASNSGPPPLDLERQVGKNRQFSDAQESSLSVSDFINMCHSSPCAKKTSI